MDERERRADPVIEPAVPLVVMVVLALVFEFRLAVVLVFGAAQRSACLIVLCFATGIRLLALPPSGASEVGSARDEEVDDVERGTPPRIATVGAVALFVAAAVGVLSGVSLLVPFLRA